MKKPVPEDVILVTGASSGLGRGRGAARRTTSASRYPATAVRTGASTHSHGARQRGRRFGYCSSAARSPRPQDPLKQAPPGAVGERSSARMERQVCAGRKPRYFQENDSTLTGDTITW